ncbi:mRNA capping enzyme-domain-containing protein [Cladorrhinum samala]|uniref:mRNA cap guanine-N(7) methyltransferase n=1 Tax=Cladorrhinum samala TaxID=585594 RepID=A0AAV9HTZ9_9PEZI|nr:mRNA capping enzyme-domain-containing protein [Cladorrhinum samala]
MTNDNDHDELPQPFDAKKLLPAAKKRLRSPSPSSRGGDGTPSSSTNSGGPARKQQKRPGQRARISEQEREQIRQRALEREAAAAEKAAAEAEALRRQEAHDVVRAHYNAVPERGRDWRKTDSRIKGLRSFNNWVKSCIIQKFSPEEDQTPGSHERQTHSGNKLLVLDIGCGKGGDLGKWQQAPQPVELYVGLDPADISIEQARDRYRNMLNRGGGRGGRGGGGRHNHGPRLFDARFHVQDCYGHSIGNLDIVRQVGFTASTVSSHKGFDVVSMMFCMHYAFETEAKARQMLQNVAGALKKGGRFIGCIPNSHVISAKVEEWNKKNEEKLRAKAEKKAKKEAAKAASEGEEGEEDDEAKEDKEDGELEDDSDEGEVEEEGASWGNDIYRVQFPGKTPANGIFRPPYGWKYNFFLHEAVEEVPEYVVPWEAFRALAEEYNLELQYHKPFADVWEAEKDDRELGPLSERMNVRDRRSGELLVSPEEMEAASFYVAFCFYRV